ncbi:MFS transporter [Kutzneria sp. NPDC052558]|uniref:MFS transporter n=1 Tax=Kutzneria sp. NPDC052558 TaxID=3364121 RepID=UPI0037C57228
MSDVILRKALGASIPPATRAPLASIGVNFAALSVFATFFGPWLVGTLGASAAVASTAYLVAGIAGVGGGYLGGRLTDRLGPRPVLLVGGGLQVAAIAVLLIPGIGVGVACAVLVIMTFLQPVRGVAQRIALASSVPDEERDAVFSGYRLVVNLGSILGPLLGAGLVAVGWEALHAEVVALYLLSFLLGRRVVAERPTPPAAQPAKRRGLFGDWRLYGLMLASTAAWTVVYGYETVLPIALTEDYGMSPSTWGLLYSLGPILVVFLQLRITRLLSTLPPGRPLVAGAVLMGASFLVLLAVGSAPLAVLVALVVLLIVVFVSGDMIWGPASEVVVLRVAPPDRRGAYVGVLTSSIWLGSALAPGIGLPLRAGFGNPALWGAFAGVGVLSAVLYVVTDRYANREISR